MFLFFLKVAGKSAVVGVALWGFDARGRGNSSRTSVDCDEFSRSRIMGMKSAIVS